MTVSNETRVETWKPVPRAAGYEVSDTGGFRSVDRTTRDGRRLRGAPMKTRTTATVPYPLVTYTQDDGKVVTGTVHRIVLETFAGPCPPGMESCHGPGGPADNRWPENLRWGTKPENEADKPVPSQLVPTFDCLNRCGSKVNNEGRRCAGCVARAGRQATAMLGAGMNLEVIAVRLDLSSDWVYKIAVEHGAYAGTKREARLQQPSVTQRLRITLRDKRPDGWGDAE